MIEVINLSKAFEGQKVVKDLSLTIRQGEVVAVIGPSGSGKSTFLRCLNRMEEKTEGTIRFKGQDIHDPDMDVDDLRRRMGMVFQQFNLFNNKTVLDNILLGPVHADLKKEKKGRPWVPSQARKKDIVQKNQDKAIKLLARIGLEDKKDAYPSTLSGGQKQRIAILRALAMDPEVILFDEPTSSLDPEMVGEVLDLIRALAKEGMTLLIVTHEMAFAREVASRILFMDEGQILEDEKPDVFFEKAHHPRAREFLSKVL